MDTDQTSILFDDLIYKMENIKLMNRNSFQYIEEDTENK